MLGNKQVNKQKTRLYDISMKERCMVKQLQKNGGKTERYSVYHYQQVGCLKWNCNTNNTEVLKVSGIKSFSRKYLFYFFKIY